MTTPPSQQTPAPDAAAADDDHAAASTSTAPVVSIDVSSSAIRRSSRKSENKRAFLRCPCCRDNMSYNPMFHTKKASTTAASHKTPVSDRAKPASSTDSGVVVKRDRGRPRKRNCAPDDERAAMDISWSSTSWSPSRKRKNSVDSATSDTLASTSCSQPVNENNNETPSSPMPPKRKRPSMRLKSLTPLSSHSSQISSPLNSTIMEKKVEMPSPSLSTQSSIAVTPKVESKRQRKYELLAQKYGIKVSSVRKHYSAFVPQARIKLIRCTSVKKELSPVRSLQNVTTSPTFGSTRKFKKVKRKIQFRSTQEPCDKSKAQPDKLVKESLDHYFDSIGSFEKKKEDGTCDITLSNIKIEPVSSKSTEKNYNSEDEFEIYTARYKREKSSKQVLLRVDKNVVENPFSAVEKTLYLQKEKVVKATKTSEPLKSLKSMEQNVTKHNNLQSTEEDLKKITKKKRKLHDGSLHKEKKMIKTKVKIEPEDNDRDKGVNESSASVSKSKKKKRHKDKKMSKPKTANSVSVQCQSLFNLNSISVEENSNESEDSPVPFGQSKDKQIEENIMDIIIEELCPESKNQAVPVTEEIAESYNLNDSYVDLLGSPGNYDDFGSPQKESQSNPSIEVEPDHVNMFSLPDIENIKENPKLLKAKPKPIIISDNKLPTNAINFKNIKINKKIPKQVTKIQSPITNGYESPSKVSSNGFEKSPSTKNGALSSTSIANGQSLSDDQLDFTHNFYGTSGKKVLSQNNEIESLDDICDQVEELINDDKITLYNDKSQRVILQGQNQDPEMCKEFSVTPKKQSPFKQVHQQRQSTPIKSVRSPEIMFDSDDSGINESVKNSETSTVNSSTVIKLYKIKRDNPVSSTNVTNSRDPRLNRTISPIKVVNSRDPRLNLSTSSTDNTTVTDLRLARKNAHDSSEVRTSSSIASTDLSNIVDPRLRKRLEREAAEKRAEAVQNHQPVEQKQPVDCDQQSHQNKPKSIFDRLGSRAESKTPVQEDFLKQEMQNVIKARRNSCNYSDDDQLSLFAGDIFSDDEDSSGSSPPHRKFTSERANPSVVMQHGAVETRQPTLSIKDRLGPARKPIQAPSNSVSATTERQPLRPNAANRQPIQAPSATATRQPLRPTVLNRNPMQAPQTTQPVKPTLEAKRWPVNSNAVFNDRFYEMNNAQLLKDAENYIAATGEDGEYVTFGSNGDDEKVYEYDFKSMLDTPETVTPTYLPTDTKTNFFSNQCYKMLRSGTCSFKESCKFQHQIRFLAQQIKQKNIDLLRLILEFAIYNNFTYFLQVSWYNMLHNLQNEMFDYYEKLYKMNVREDSFIGDMLEYSLETNLHTAESFIKKIAPILDVGDKKTVHALCRKIKGKLTNGFCWETIKDLCQKAVPPRDMVELAIIQCLKRKKNTAHIMEVYDMVENKLSIAEKSRLSDSLRIEFTNLVQTKGISRELSPEARVTAPLMNSTQQAGNVQSRSQKKSQSAVGCTMEPELEQPKDNAAPVVPAKILNRKQSLAATNINDTSHMNVRQPNNSPLEVKQGTSSGESTNFANYDLKEMDCQKLESMYRDRHWKLFLNAGNISEALKHSDYDLVWKILDEYSTERIEDNLLKRAYYQILCKDVKKSETHLKELIRRAVRQRWSTSPKSIELLFDVGVFALIDLADSDLWVMALKLLESLKMIEPDEPRIDFILMSCEIYIANQDFLGALYLLQKTRVIRTNRDEWLVKKSTKEDEKHRNDVVFLLLKGLSYTHPDEAVYLFKALFEDQYIYHHPIDLSSHVDKLVLLLLLHRKDELAAEICRLVMDNDLTFQKPTYQELLCRMLPLDDVLANQILDYAINLGYYNDMKISTGYTTIIMDSNLLEEEIYLILKRLIYKLILNVGPVIDRLKPHQLKVIIIFEDIPNDKRLYRNEIGLMSATSRYKDIRDSVNKMLATRFQPALRIARGKAEKYCKLVCKTLVDHLKHWSEM